MIYPPQLISSLAVDTSLESPLAPSAYMDTSYRSDSWAISSGCGVCPHRVAISRIVSEGSLLKRTYRFEETPKPRWTEMNSSTIASTSVGFTLRARHRAA